ncbi:MAG: exo-alpha-sialidase [Ignavibacteriae bacterium]|nr:MAG: exo-alpha-sialidase [Ignavibacteriota bacterium]
MTSRFLTTLLAIAFFSMPAQAQFWEITTGPPASTTCLATNSKGHVFAGTASSAVYRSTDLGVTWERYDQGIDDGISNFKTVNMIKVGVNDELFASVNGLGVLRSRDDGKTWQILPINIDVKPTSRITVSTEVINNKSAVFVGYDGGSASLFMRYSDNGGDSFVEIPKSNIPSAASSIFEVFLSPNSNLMFVLVSYNKGLYRSTNMGTSWTRIDSDPSSGESNDNFLTMTANRNGVLYIGRNSLPGSTKSPNAVVMRSTNDGTSWEYLLNGWDNRDVTNNRIQGISFGKDNDVYAITEKVSGVFYSSNGGDQWVSRNDGLPGDASGQDIVVTNNNHVFVAPTGAFIHRHLDPTMSVKEDIASILQNTTAYPNPARDEVFITVDLASDAAVNIDLTSIGGMQAVTPYHAMHGAGQHTISFNTSHLAPGLYAWTMSAGGEVKRGTVVVR